MRQVFHDTKQINGFGVREVSCVRLARTYSTTVNYHRLKQQIFAGMEALEGIAQLVTDIRTAFFLDLRHTRCIVQQRVHRIEIERP